MAKNSKKAEVRNKDQFTVVLEDINGKFDVIVEATQSLGQRMDRVEEKIDNIEEKVENLDVRVFNLEIDQKKMRAEFAAGQHLTLEYLERIEADLHTELKNKVDQEDHVLLKNRVTRLELPCVRDNSASYGNQPKTRAKRPTKK